MTAYDLHISEVNFQHVPAHHALQQLTRRFGSKILIDSIIRMEERDKQSVQERESDFTSEEFVLQ